MGHRPSARMSLLALPVLSILTDTRAIFLFLGLSYKTRKKNEPVLALPMFIPIQPSQTLLYSFTKPPSLVNFLKMTALGVNGLWSSQAHSFQLVGPNQTFTFTRSCVPETQNNNMHTDHLISGMAPHPSTQNPLLPPILPLYQ